MNYAAIDIGSNAVRMMIAAINDSGTTVNYKKISLVRIPLRLGDDAFIDQRLSVKKTRALQKTMEVFRNMMDLHHVSDYMACATSAMREASNGQEIIADIKKKIGLDIRIIDGQAEAEIIYSGHIKSMMDKNKSYLYIDVGGGSTELSFFSKCKVVASASFNIGTIRILDNKDSEETWNEMKRFVRKNTRGLKNLYGIGTGGNINKLFKLSEEKSGSPLSYARLKSTYEYLRSYSLKDRINILGLNHDRADVILPASEIYLSVMKWAAVKKINVPQRGLVDGMINRLIEKNFGQPAD